MIDVQAPFPMASLNVPRACGRTFSIADYGAVADGTTKNTDAFAKAIDAAMRAGGGTVRVPPGTWLTGPIHVIGAHDLRLQLDAGAEVLFSTDFNDYLPPVFTRWEGMEVMNWSPLVYFSGCTNVALTGEGKLNGQGWAWWGWKSTQKADANALYAQVVAGDPVEKRVYAHLGGLRPTFVEFVKCKNVIIEGVTIADGPQWTIHPLYSENVIVRKVTVNTKGGPHGDGTNGDGCNPDSCRNVLIEDSYFNTSDDCIAIKSGLNEDGWRVGIPSENVVVRRIRSGNGHGGVTVGSEMSGGVRNVFAYDNDLLGVDRALRIKTMPGRGGEIRNIHYQDIRVDSRILGLEVTTNYASSTVVPATRTPPRLRGLFYSKIRGRAAAAEGQTNPPLAAAIHLEGLKDVPIEDVEIKDFELTADLLWDPALQDPATGTPSCIDACDVRLRKVAITATQGDSLMVTHGPLVCPRSAGADPCPND